MVNYETNEVGFFFKWIRDETFFKENPEKCITKEKEVLEKIMESIVLSWF